MWGIGTKGLMRGVATIAQGAARHLSCSNTRVEGKTAGGPGAALFVGLLGSMQVHGMCNS